MRTSALILAASFTLLAVALASADRLAAYQVGDTITTDIVAARRLIVIDEEGTEALKQKEAQREPAIFVCHPEAVEEVERDFRAAISMVRSNFFDAMWAVYQKRHLNPQWLTTTRFKTLSATFRRQHREFPNLDNLMLLWATGKSDQPVQDALVARLRAAMQPHIRTDTLAPEIKLGAQVRLVTLTNAEEVLTLETAEKLAVTVQRSNLLTLNRVRSEFQQLATPTERGFMKTLASYLKPNCSLDTELTYQARKRRVRALYVADRYEAGQIIARRGQKVDAKIMAALEQMRTMQVQPPPGQSEGRMEVPRLYRLNLWLWTGLALTMAGSFVGLWRLIKRRKLVSVLPARLAGGGATASIISCPSCDENIVIPTEVVETLVANTTSWERRALAAEQRAERAHAVIRAGVLTQLVDWFKQKFVRRLVSERWQLLDAQQSATAELAELERRLDDLHVPLQERLHAYEKRIGELEQLLALKGQENRELLRAKIQMTRQQLESARTRNRLEFN